MNDLIHRGVKGDNGMLQGFPPNTGVGWATIGTGTWPGEHGSTNNTFFRMGEANFNNNSSFAGHRHPAGRPHRPVRRALGQVGGRDGVGCGPLARARTPRSGR